MKKLFLSILLLVSSQTNAMMLRTAFARVAVPAAQTVRINTQIRNAQCHNVLGVSTDATEKEIRTVFNKKAFNGYRLAKDFTILLKAKEDALKYANVDFSNLNLHDATFNNDLKKVQSLINNGADVNKYNRVDLTPLDIAIYKGNLEMVQVLVKNGADINQPGFFAKTPLDAALKENHSEIFMFLIKLGAGFSK